MIASKTLDGNKLTVALDGRIDTLTAMYHETSLTAYTLERYYEKGGR